LFITFGFKNGHLQLWSTGHAETEIYFSSLSFIGSFVHGLQVGTRKVSMQIKLANAELKWFFNLTDLSKT